MLEIINLSKTYGTKKALDNINFKLENGIYGLLGPNGAGKSTLMNIITENLSADQGKILWNGQENMKLGVKYREILGYMPQQQGLYNGFTGKRFLNYIAVLKDIPKEKIQGLDPKERVRVKKLLKELAEDKIIIIATHIVPDIENIAKEIIILKKGVLIEKSNPEELIKKYTEQGDLEDVYMSIFGNEEDERP